MSLPAAVTITITRATAALTYAGFGTAMVLGCHKHWRDRIKYYSTTAEMVTDGFETTDPEYIWATGYFSQQPHPAQIDHIRIAQLLEQLHREEEAVKEYQIASRLLDFSERSGSQGRKK